MTAHTASSGRPRQAVALFQNLMTGGFLYLSKEGDDASDGSLRLFVGEYKTPLTRTALIDVQRLMRGTTMYISRAGVLSETRVPGLGLAVWCAEPGTSYPLERCNLDFYEVDEAEQGAAVRLKGEPS